MAKKPALSHAAPSVDFKNAKTRFDNCELLLDTGLLCARLGMARDEPSGFLYRGAGLSIAAHVQKGKERDKCQDCAFVFSYDGIVAAGVLDGYGSQGTFLSEAVADALIRLLDGQRDSLHLRCDAKTLLVSAVSEVVLDITMPPSPMDYGGSTAVFSLLMPDGRFSVAGIADSAFYVLGKKGSRRLLRYEDDCNGMPYTSLPVSSFFYKRNIVDKTITLGGINESAVETAEGVLGPEEGLLLATDGITKSLGMVIDPLTSHLVDCSGCRDLSRILRGKKAAPDVVRTVIENMENRILKARDREKLVRIVKDMAYLPEDDDMGIIAITR